MTLVISGHETQENSSGAVFGLFVMADSTITDGRQTLLNGFKKVYSVPIKVYEPYFVNGYFRSYMSARLETECFIAFAGSTLTAQHVLNSISNHLCKLRYAYEGSSYSTPGTYQILMDCEKNSLLNSNPGNQWDEDMFLFQDIDGLLSGDIIARTILHSIEAALSGAKHHKIDQGGWSSLLSQYVVGTYCEIKKRNRLFTFKPKFEKDTDGVIVNIVVDQEEIKLGEIVVLGMEERFAERIKQEFKRALKAKADVKAAMFTLLNEAIDEVQKSGGKEIARPSILYSFDRGKLTVLNRNKTELNI